MKPRSAIQKQLVEWAGALPPLDEHRKEWAKKLFPAEALYYSRRGNHSEFHCLCCGSVVPMLGKWDIEPEDGHIDKWICPECGAECDVLPQYNSGFGHNYNPRTRQYSKKATNERLVTLIDVFHGIQVFRTFDVYRWNGRSDLADGTHRGCPTEYMFQEVFQNWVFDDGAEIITARHYTRSPFSFNWAWHSEYGINGHNDHCSGCYQMEDVFDTSGNFMFPGIRVTKRLRRNGFSSKCAKLGVCPAKISVRLLKDNLYEELVKLGQYRMAAFMLDHKRHNLKDYIYAIRICTRHGYKIKDPSMWLDYLDDLAFLGMDTHNPKFLCPEKLSDAHGRTHRRRLRVEREIEKQKKKQEIERYEPLYAESKRPFFGIVFGDDTVIISVIQTVNEVSEEADAMHHCVFSNDYWKHNDSVLLSARDNNGKRVETIEIGLDPYKVLQSRGLENKKTKYHDRIVSLCDANMKLFRKAARQMTVPLHERLNAV